MNSSIKKILVAVKHGEHGLPLSHAQLRLMARNLDAEVALLSCVSKSSASSGFIWADPAEATPKQTLSLDQVEDALERLAQPIRDGGVAVTTRVSTKAPVYGGILDEAAEWNADLLIVGIHEPTLVPHTRLTDTDWQLMRLCPCPLLIVRDPNVEPYRTVLAGVDPLRGHAEPAGLDSSVLRAAAELSRAFDADLRIASVYPNPEDFEIVSAVQVRPGVFYGTENIAAAHREAVADLIEECGIAGAEPLLRPGEPTEVILGLVEELEAGVIVLGSVKRGQIEAAVLGSTAETIVTEASCDVLLVKPPPT